MYESAENELKENNNGFGYLFDVKISWIFFQNMNVNKLPPLLLNGLPTVTLLTRGQFHKTIYDIFLSQKDRMMFLNQNLCFIKRTKFTKFSLFGINLRS